MSGYIGNDGSALAGGINASGQVQGLSVDNTGKLNVNASVSSTLPTSSVATLTSVAGATSSTALLASNGNRKGMMIFNDSTAILYLAFASSASTTAYTVQVAPGGFYEMPSPIYTGALYGIWSAANGNARITELT